MKTGKRTTEDYATKPSLSAVAEHLYSSLLGSQRLHSELYCTLSDSHSRTRIRSAHLYSSGGYARSSDKSLNTTCSVGQRYYEQSRVDAVRVINTRVCLHTCSIFRALFSHSIYCKTRNIFLFELCSKL